MESMKISKRIISLFIMVLVIGNLLGGCAKKEDKPTNTDNPQTSSGEKGNTDSKDTASKEETNEHPLGLTPFKQKKPLKVNLGIVGGIDEDEKALWFEEVTRLTGIEFNIKESNVDADLNNIFAAGESYDILYMNGGGYKKFLPLGMISPITDKIENSKILSDPEIIDPKYWERVREDDGQLYVVYNKYDGATLPIMREDWMRKLNLKAPTTLAEYEEVFRAFTENDPDGNGKDDTYGLVLREINDITPWMSAKGLVADYALDGNGDPYIPWATEEAAEVYDWIGNLYAKGYLEPNFATNGSSDCREAIFSNKAGAFVYWDFWTGTFNTKARAENPDTTFEMKAYGPALDANGNGILMEGSPAYFVIPETAQDPDTAFALLEFLHTFEGNLTTTLGIKGYDYEVKDGQYTLTEIGEKHAMNHGSTVPFSMKWENPVFTPMNSPEAMDIVRQYGVPRLELQGTDLARDVVKKYAVMAMMQEMTGAEAVKKMQKELKEMNLIK